MRNNKGFTILEAVIAMSVIMIVSVGAISAIVTANKISDKSNMQYFAVNEVNNLKECFISDSFAVGEGSALALYFDDIRQPFRLTENSSKGCYVYSFYYDEYMNLLYDSNTGYCCVRFTVTKDMKRANMCAYRINENNPDEVQYLYEMKSDEFVYLK